MTDPSNPVHQYSELFALVRAEHHAQCDEYMRDELEHISSEENEGMAFAAKVVAEHGVDGIRSLWRVMERLRGNPMPLDAEPEYDEIWKLDDQFRPIIEACPPDEHGHAPRFHAGVLRFLQCSGVFDRYWMW